MNVTGELRLVLSFAAEVEEHSAHVVQAAEGLLGAARALQAAWQRDQTTADPTELLVELGSAQHVIKRLVGAVEGVEDHVGRLPVRLHLGS